MCALLKKETNTGFNVSMSLLSVTPLDIWVQSTSSLSWHCFYKPCGKAYNVIRTAVNSCPPPPHPSISNSIIEPSCCIVGSLACNASAVYSVYWGAAWQFQLSPETHWKAFLLKINPVHPRPASQPCRPCAACRLASPSPLIHCSVPFMQKPSYGCARAGAGAFKPSATHALSLRHTQTQIKTQRKHIYKKNTQIVPPRTACSCTSVHSLYRKTLNLWTCKSQTACTWSSPVHHISNSMIGF